ncbi:hypothetical protein [Fimbriiglobus ruber]|uniref:DUF998 domain-containing protein n=1 Tax=Fimbriiglobus ruber TaxID=1908690 RepID=A0A225D7J7_9BACT|nr:hypothetical protein [Fimbriiglobus ruber]OWK36943.1 hypothetical protein FRUB_07865 [Fimbriiglobus ruber]
MSCPPLAYLGYGYFDSWHGAATLFLLPCFLTGMGIWWFRHRDLKAVAREPNPPLVLPWLRHLGMGRMILLFVACGMMAGGLTITAVGMTCVFVPEDVAYLGVGRAELTAINPRLVPLIAHDRAGFGGAVCCCGILLAGVAWRAEMSRALWQALAAVGAAGFGTAVFVHPAIGYTDWWHLTPAVGGAVLYAAGLFFAGKQATS